MSTLYGSEQRQHVQACCHKVGTATIKYADKILILIFFTGLMTGMIDDQENCKLDSPTNTTRRLMISENTNAGYKTNCTANTSSVILAFTSLIGLLASVLWSLWRTEKIRNAIQRQLRMPVDVELNSIPLIPI